MTSQRQFAAQGEALFGCLRLMDSEIQKLMHRVQYLEIEVQLLKRGWMITKREEDAEVKDDKEEGEVDPDEADDDKEDGEVHV